MPGCLVLVESNTSGTGRLFATTARRLGFEPLLLARDPNRYPYIVSERLNCLRVNTHDADAVLDLCMGLSSRPSGIVTSSEFAVPVAAATAARLGLCGPDPDVAFRVRDKAWQRARLLAAGLDTTRHAVCASSDDLREVARKLGFPLVVKPRSASGSTAVRLVQSEGELAGATIAAMHATGCDTVLVEEFISGKEYSAEMFDGEVVGLTAKHLGAPPFFVETGHDFPAPVDPTTAARISLFAGEVAQALGLIIGPAHLELRDDGQRSRLIEANPRLAGGYIPRIVQLATGIDLIEATILRAVGRPVSLEPGHDSAASIRFVMTTGHGRLCGLDFQRAQDSLGVAETLAYREAGTELTITGDFTDRIGHVITTGRDAAVNAEAAVNLVRVQLDEAQSCV